MKRKFHVRCGAGEKLEICMIMSCKDNQLSKIYLLLYSRLRLEAEKKSSVLLVDCGLLFVMLLAVAAAIFLYLDWQAQLNYFLS